jgi:hypothetical protein
MSSFKPRGTPRPRAGSVAAQAVVQGPLKKTPTSCQNSKRSRRLCQSSPGRVGIQEMTGTLGSLTL